MRNHQPGPSESTAIARSGSRVLDAIVIGAGPNGLSAAITLALAGRSVRVYEAERTIGGGIRSASLTAPGTVHDVCASVHALAVASPFLRALPLADYGFEVVHPDALRTPAGRPDGGRCGAIDRRDGGRSARG